MAPPSPLIVKFVYQKTTQDIRRICVENPTLFKLRQLVSTLYGIEHFCLKYADQDNELVTLKSEDDFNYANFPTNNQPFRLYVTEGSHFIIFDFFSY